MNDRLYRSVDDRVIAGVCGGLAVRMGVDPSLVRIGYAIVALLSGIFPLLVLYIVMAAVVPEEPTGFAGVGRYPAPPGPDSIPGWTPPGAGASAGWGPAPQGADAGAVPLAGAVGPDESAPVTDASAAGPPPAGAPAPGAPSWSTPPTWQAPPSWSRRRARRERRERREGDALPAIIGGLVLVALGAWFLVRDRLAVDWGVVWAAGLVALGVIVVIAAFRPRSGPSS